MKVCQSVVDRFSGFSEIYDQFRPRTPRIIPELLLKYSGSDSGATVVDLGCATGLSTFVWAELAEKVFGVDVNEELINMARAKQADREVYSRTKFIQCAANETDIPAESADIVTCSQSFHYMEPQSTLLEIDRILRKGGVFCAYDYELPPVGDWELELAFEQLLDGFVQLPRVQRPRQWPKAEHLARLCECGYFRFVRGILAHAAVEYDHKAMVGLLLSHGLTQSVLKWGHTQRGLGIDAFDRFAAKRLKGQAKPMLLSYKLRVAVK